MSDKLFNNRRFEKISDPATSDLSIFASNPPQTQQHLAQNANKVTLSNFDSFSTTPILPTIPPQTTQALPSHASSHSSFTMQPQQHQLRYHPQPQSTQQMSLPSRTPLRPNFAPHTTDNIVSTQESRFTPHLTQQSIHPSQSQRTSHFSEIPHSTPASHLDSAHLHNSGTTSANRFSDMSHHPHQSIQPMQHQQFPHPTRTSSMNTNNFNTNDKKDHQSQSLAKTSSFQHSPSQPITLQPSQSIHPSHNSLNHFSPKTRNQPHFSPATHQTPRNFPHPPPTSSTNHSHSLYNSITSLNNNTTNSFHFHQQTLSPQNPHYQPHDSHNFQNSQYPHDSAPHIHHHTQSTHQNPFTSFSPTQQRISTSTGSHLEAPLLSSTATNSTLAQPSRGPFPHPINTTTHSSTSTAPLSPPVSHYQPQSYSKRSQSTHSSSKHDHHDYHPHRLPTPKISNPPQSLPLFAHNSTLNPPPPSHSSHNHNHTTQPKMPILINTQTQTAKSYTAILKPSHTAPYQFSTTVIPHDNGMETVLQTSTHVRKKRKSTLDHPTTVSRPKYANQTRNVPFWEHDGSAVVQLENDDNGEEIGKSTPHRNTKKSRSNRVESDGDRRDDDDALSKQMSGDMIFNPDYLKHLQTQGVLKQLNFLTDCLDENDVDADVDENDEATDTASERNNISGLGKELRGNFGGNSSQSILLPPSLYKTYDPINTIGMQANGGTVGPKSKPYQATFLSTSQALEQMVGKKQLLSGHQLQEQSNLSELRRKYEMKKNAQLFRAAIHDLQTPISQPTSHPLANLSQLPEFDDELTSSSTQQHSSQLPPKAATSCNCKKSQCLSMRCGCFSFGGFCSPTCKCVNCLNNTASEGNLIKRSMKLIAIKKKNPLAFTPQLVRLDEPLEKQTSAVQQNGNTSLNQSIDYEDDSRKARKGQASKSKNISVDLINSGFDSTETDFSQNHQATPDHLPAPTSSRNIKQLARKQPKTTSSLASLSKSNSKTTNEVNISDTRQSSLSSSSTTTTTTQTASTSVLINVSGCNCKHNRCTSMSCVCFKFGARCGFHCGCIGCCNDKLQIQSFNDDNNETKQNSTTTSLQREKMIKNNTASLFVAQFTREVRRYRTELNKAERKEMVKKVMKDDEILLTGLIAEQQLANIEQFQRSDDYYLHHDGIDDESELSPSLSIINTSSNSPSRQTHQLTQQRQSKQSKGPQIKHPTLTTSSNSSIKSAKETVPPTTITSPSTTSTTSTTSTSNTSPLVDFSNNKSTHSAKSHRSRPHSTYRSRLQRLQSEETSTTAESSMFDSTVPRSNSFNLSHQQFSPPNTSTIPLEENDFHSAISLWFKPNPSINQFGDINFDILRQQPQSQYSPYGFSRPPIQEPLSRTTSFTLLQHLPSGHESTKGQTIDYHDDNAKVPRSPTTSSLTTQHPSSTFTPTTTITTPSLTPPTKLKLHRNGKLSTLSFSPTPLSLLSSADFTNQSHNANSHEITTNLDNSAESKFIDIISDYTDNTDHTDHVGTSQQDAEDWEERKQRKLLEQRTKENTFMNASVVAAGSINSPHIASALNVSQNQLIVTRNQQHEQTASQPPPVASTTTVVGADETPRVLKSALKVKISTTTFPNPQQPPTQFYPVPSINDVYFVPQVRRKQKSNL